MKTESRFYGLFNRDSFGYVVALLIASFFAGSPAIYGEGASGWQPATIDQCIKKKEAVDEKCTRIQETVLPSPPEQNRSGYENALLMNQYCTNAALTYQSWLNGCETAFKNCERTCTEVDSPKYINGVRESARERLGECRETYESESKKMAVQMDDNKKCAVDAQVTADARRALNPAPEPGNTAPGDPATAPADDVAVSPAGGSYAPSSGGGFGLNSGTLMSGLMGAGVAVGAMCLLGSLCEDDEKDKNKDKDEDGSATVTDGEEEDEPIDCALAANYSDASCSDQYVNLCLANPRAPECGAFGNDYCKLGSTTNNDTSPTATTGVGSPVCQLLNSHRFCESAGRDVCPTCQNLERMNSPACQSNPSLCLPQMTAEDRQIAQSSCPTDPLFSNPEFNAGGGFGSGSGSDSGSGTGSVSGATGSSASVASTSSGNLVGSANANSTSPGSANSSGSTSLASTSGAGYNGSATQFGSPSANVTVSVSADLAPALGPGLFNNHSAIIQQRCETGSLNHCGPRVHNSGSAVND